MLGIMVRSYPRNPFGCRPDPIDLDQHWRPGTILTVVTQQDTWLFERSLAGGIVGADKIVGVVVLQAPPHFVGDRQPSQTWISRRFTRGQTLTIGGPEPAGTWYAKPRWPKTGAVISVFCDGAQIVSCADYSPRPSQPSSTRF